ncbi:hypothetical protein [Limosilactobacillus caecicola]|uniref:hypothetical protein n=1 Tax=Limosilactobacillus caecicola TaxID=2941332 RepID=UPI00203F21A3|nr:hypothetical protein [Limosilactobacillus caecicola]
MNDRTLIDPQKFALKFAQTAINQNVNNDQLVKEAKKFLMSYLTAYYLVEDFNDIERQNFGDASTKKFEDMTFEELLNRVRELNKY